ncbi:SSU ribosomal protein S3P [Isosphaera pallida ATCC 43644]|uniref:Small ribosomal subunit protein uS3 n=1 Tax=Isosphaera pallida (strain ATCC 43644 / DSM 9630 / IS1B) TaxID=575540 RepID=E8R3T0_ISOPI|nr:30S ribosomal protein S3 [Isosphaera pallida]ADV62665.1 SSU ribosomal protein S3P [Isosphaera pallida ATCC 43644]
MGQKVRPTGFRVGIMEDWRSRWYASKQDFSDLLVEDFKIRKYIKTKHGNAGIPKVEIERTRDAVKVILFTARPGVIIGKKGAEVEKLQEELQKLTGRRIDIKIEEVNRPEINAQLIAEDIADQLQRRVSFRRTIKRAQESTMEAGAKGVKVQLSGRLGGAEMSRTEQGAAGSIPLSTLRAKIDYGFAEAKTPQGHIGIKVWVNQGDYLKLEGSADGHDAQKGEVSKKSKRPRKR